MLGNERRLFCMQCICPSSHCSAFISEILDGILHQRQGALAEHPAKRYRKRTLGNSCPFPSYWPRSSSRLHFLLPPSFVARNKINPAHIYFQAAGLCLANLIVSGGHRKGSCPYDNMLIFANSDPGRATSKRKKKRHICFPDTRTTSLLSGRGNLPSEKALAKLQFSKATVEELRNRSLEKPCTSISSSTVNLITTCKAVG